MVVLELSDEQIFDLALQMPGAKQGELVARLQEENQFSTATPPAPRVPGQDRGKIWIADDFNDPLPDEIQRFFE